MVIKEIEVKDILTKTNLPVSDYAVNPYVGCTHACKYCYASFMKRFTNHPEPWGEFVDIKTWPEINKPGKYAGKEAFFCSVTDPYQPLEAKYGRTRALLEQLLDTGISISISTKSDLILRDLDLIKQFPSAHVSWSINTLDEDFRKEMDRAVSIERRLEAMRQFYEAGIQSTCFISPIFPGITDPIEIIERANRTLIDLTGDTVEAAKILSGYTAHDKSGAPITGSCSFDVDSTDGTAAVAEILVSKTAYARGTKLTGTMPNNGSVTGAISSVGGEYTIPMGFHDGSGKVGIAGTEAEKIVAGNIKAGVEILGVTGTYSGEEITAQSKTVTPRTTAQTVQPDSGYDYLSAVTVNAIPYTESDNSAGGVTVTIGG